MKLAFELTTNLKIPEVTAAMENAARLALRDTVVAVHSDSIRNAKSVGFWDTGNNARSLTGEVAGMGKVAGEGTEERMVDEGKLQGAVYSTSGYGGYGETGTRFMAARPYMKPALDREFTAEKIVERMKRHIK